MKLLMKSCSIIGHRVINVDQKLILNIKNTIVNLIETEYVTKFLFGSNSSFDELCYDIVTELKSTFKQISRIYVRAEYPLTNYEYIKYIKSLYEDSYFYSDDLHTYKSSYIKRNETIIDNSDFCLFYYNPEYVPINNKSGTKLAYKYATRKKKQIINIYSL